MLIQNKERIAMGFLRKLLGLEKKEEASGRKGISIEETFEYEEDLIDQFKDDHLELFEIFAQIKETYEENPEFSHKLVDLLDEFKTGLEMHILVEDKKLYTYLRKKYGGDELHEAMLNDLQRNMTKIAKSVIFFVKKYSNRENFERNKDKFLKDLGEVGDTLTKRTSMEERKLYPMYSKQ